MTSNCIPKYLYKEIEADVHKKTCFGMFRVVLFIGATTENDPNVH